MKTMKLSRALVAVLLVCALLFSWSPVKAHAVDPVTATVGVLALSLAASVLIGCGIQLGNELGAFEALANSLVGAWEAAGWVKDNVVDVYFKDGFTYVPSDLIGFTKDWLWGEGILIDGSSIPENYLTNSGFMEWYDSYVSNYKYVVAFWGANSCTLCVTNIAPFLLVSGSDWDGSYTGCSISGYSNSSFNYYQYYLSTNTGSGVFTDTYYKGRSPYSVVGVDSVSGVDTSYDLTLGDVAGQDEDLATGYPEWAGQSVALTPSGTDTVITGYPVSTPATYEEAITQTQTEAQSGTTSITDTDVAVGTLDGTLAETEAKTFVEVIAGYFNNVVTAIKAMPDAIVTGITDALTAVFVPSEDYLTAKVDAIRDEFAFADSIISSGESIKGYLDSIGPEPPVIYINLDDFEGGYDIGGQVAFLDLRWYERYKPTGDAIISAFLWLVFAWRVFIHLPGLISGARGVVGFSVSSANETGLSSSETGLRRYD